MGVYPGWCSQGHAWSMPESHIDAHASKVLNLGSWPMQSCKNVQTGPDWSRLVDPGGVGLVDPGGLGLVNPGGLGLVNPGSGHLKI